jgi:hypothetical protein
VASDKAPDSDPNYAAPWLGYRIGARGLVLSQ